MGMDEPKTMTTIFVRIRKIMFRFGDLPSLEADPSLGLSNGEILARLREINENPQIDNDSNRPMSEGQSA